MTSLDKPEIGTSTVRWRFPAVHPEGYKFAAIAFGLSLLLFLLWQPLGWLGVLVTIYAYAFPAQ